MKVLLISSNLSSQFPMIFPFATSSLSSFLKEKGYIIKQLHFERKRELKKLLGVIKDFSPDVIGCSIYSCEIPIYPRLTSVIKKWKKNIPVICGGVHVTVDPLSILNWPTVDAICYGEGELSFLDYLEKLKSGLDVTDTAGFWFKKGGKIIKNPPRPFIENLDTLPFYDYSQINLQKVIDANNGCLLVLFGKGCNSSCRFCCNEDLSRANTGTYVRNRSVKRVTENLRYLHAHYKFNSVCIRDDNFPWNKNWVLEFCKEYPKNFSTPIEIYARVDYLDEEIMNALKVANCVSIFIGLDSGNDYIRNKILHKIQTNEQLLRVTKYMKSIGIYPIVSNIVGLPYETMEMHQDTIRINQQIYNDFVAFTSSQGAAPKIWVFDPWPGSKLFDLCRNEGWLEEKRHKVYRESILNMPQFGKKDIHKCYHNFRYRVYKNNFPIRALLFRFYDMTFMQRFMEYFPKGGVGIFRRRVLFIMKNIVEKISSCFPKIPHSSISG